MNRVLQATTFLALFAAASCSGGTPPISSGERYVSNADLTEVYQLGAGDKVRISIFNEPQMNGEYAVSTEGQLSLPLIGNVSVTGQTTRQTADAVQALFANGYLLNPRVSIEVVTYRPFFILGEVRTPGQYPYTSGLTAMNAIATAAGFTPRAKRKIVLIRRFGEQYEQEYRLTPELRIWPGDTIRLAERYF